MLQLLFGLAMILHGIGHVLFLANAWGMWKTADTRTSMFVTTLHMGQTTEGLLGVLWILPLIGFLAAGWGYTTDAKWWSTVALGVAAFSCILILVWLDGINGSSAMFAFLFNLLVIAVVLWKPAFLLSGN
jgi:hypothetical protein